MTMRIVFLKDHKDKKAETEYFIDRAEAIKLCEEISGKKMNWRYLETNRIGDHIWYISDVNKFKSHYPNWNITYDINKILNEIFINNKEKWS